MGRVLHPTVCPWGHLFHHHHRLRHQPTGQVPHPEVCPWGRLFHRHHRLRHHLTCPVHQPKVQLQPQEEFLPKRPKLDPARHPEASLLYRRCRHRRRHHHHRHHRRCRPQYHHPWNWSGPNPHHHWKRQANPNQPHPRPLLRRCPQVNHLPASHRQTNQTCHLPHQLVQHPAIQPFRQNRGRGLRWSRRRPTRLRKPTRSDHFSMWCPQ